VVFMSFLQTTPMFLQKGKRSFVDHVNGLTADLKGKTCKRNSQRQGDRDLGLVEISPMLKSDSQLTTII